MLTATGFPGLLPHFRPSAELYMHHEHPSFFLMIATRLGREAHVTGICKFSRTKSNHEVKKRVKEKKKKGK